MMGAWYPSQLRGFILSRARDTEFLQENQYGSKTSKTPNLDKTSTVL
jgi:hypothetical protein